MKQEDIEKAAQSRCDRRFSYLHNNAFFDGFISGAEWRINSVWHDIKEIPENNRMILIIMQYNIPTVLGPDNSFFKEEVKDRQIQRWAYIKDLIPDKEE